jgi:hypothetical protein
MPDIFFESKNLRQSKIGSYTNRWFYVIRLENTTISNFWVGRFYTNRMALDPPPSIYCVINKDNNKAYYFNDDVHEWGAVLDKKAADKLHDNKINALNDIFKGTTDLKDEKQAEEYAKTIIAAYNKIDCVFLDRNTLKPILDLMTREGETIDKTTINNMTKGSFCIRYDNDTYLFQAYTLENRSFAYRFPANFSHWMVILKKNGEILNAKRKIIQYW